MRLMMILFFSFSFTALAKIAPFFQGELIDGGKVSLKEKLKPDRGLLICFWATWCSPCLEELRNIGEKLKSDPSLALDVLTVNVDTSETSSDVKPTLRLYKFEFPVILDPKHEIFGKYHDSKTLPYSVLVTSAGKIEASFMGYDEAMIPKVKQILAVQSPRTPRANP